MRKTEEILLPNIKVICDGKTSFYHRLSIYNQLHGHKYQKVTEDGKKIGRSTYLVKTLEDFGCIVENLR